MLTVLDIKLDLFFILERTNLKIPITYLFL